MQSTAAALPYIRKISSFLFLLKFFFENKTLNLVRNGKNKSTLRKRQRKKIEKRI